MQPVYQTAGYGPPAVSGHRDHQKNRRRQVTRKFTLNDAPQPDRPERPHLLGQL